MQHDDPFDHNQFARLALSVASEADRTPLAEDSAPRAPGAYLLFLAAPLPVYGDFATGRWPVYAGSTTDLAARRRRHILNLRGVTGLRTEHFQASWLPQPTFGAALHVEDVLIAELQPPWCRPPLRGWGSKSQGRTRVAGQRPSAWDGLHPGRLWSQQPTDLLRALAHVALLEVVANPWRPPVTWSPLQDWREVADASGPVRHCHAVTRDDRSRPFTSLAGGLS